MRSRSKAVRARNADRALTEIWVGLRSSDRLARIVGGTQSAGNDGTSAAVDQIDLCRKRVDSNDFRSIIGESTRRNCADITQPKDTDSQDAYLSRVARRPTAGV
jgi:hypothetical protein